MKKRTMLTVFFLLSLAQGANAGAIRADQVGYLPDEAKIAVGENLKAGAFYIKDAKTSRTVLTGRWSPSVLDKDTGRRVRRADFSSLKAPGLYTLSGPLSSQPATFKIAPDVYREVAFLSMRSFYGQRCGTRVDLGQEFPGFSYEACHMEDGGFHPSSGRKGFRKSQKGWHDAGDYGKYIVNSGISTGTLLYAWELYGPALKNLPLQIPESGGPLPDFLAEVKWNLDWMLTMQDDDGGVWHKLTSETFCGFIRPEDDKDKRWIIGTGEAPFKSSAATADFAAVMALASRHYRPYDPVFSKKCLRAAERTWTWLDRHPNVTFRNPPRVKTGGYGDGDCSDERLWAAVELWRATKGEYYHGLIKTQTARREPPLFNPTNPPAWPQVAALAYFSYALEGTRAADPTTLDAIRNSLFAAADGIAARTAAAPYRNSMLTHNYIWGSSSVALNYSMMLLAADRLSPKRAWKEAAWDNLHYLLGRNGFGVSWVSGVGSNPFKHPHHRPTAACSGGRVWPGLISGGPNAGKQDPAMKRLPASTPPALCWVDDQESYAGNEVAINWNAPLVFVLAATLP